MCCCFSWQVCSIVAILLRQLVSSWSTHIAHDAICFLLVGNISDTFSFYNYNDKTEICIHIQSTQRCDVHLFFFLFSLSLRLLLAFSRSKQWAKKKSKRFRLLSLFIFLGFWRLHFADHHEMSSFLFLCLSLLPSSRNRNSILLHLLCPAKVASFCLHPLAKHILLFWREHSGV